MPSLYSVLCAGVWPAIPLTGSWLGIAPNWTVGILVWSVPLLALAGAGHFHPEWLGAAGWILTIYRLRTARVPRLPEMLLTLVLGAAFFFVGAKSILNHELESLAPANLALTLLERKTIDAPYPFPPDTPPALQKLLVQAAPQTPAGDPPVFAPFFPTFRTLQPGLRPLFAVWLAQGAATAGTAGIDLVPRLFALLSALAFFAFAKAFVSERLAIAATLVAALLPGVLRLAGTGLPLPLETLLIWSALGLLAQKRDYGFAGVIAGAVTFVSLPALILLFPLGLAARADSDGPAVRTFCRAFFVTAIAGIVSSILLAPPTFVSDVALFGERALLILAAPVVTEIFTRARTRMSRLAITIACHGGIIPLLALRALEDDAAGSPQRPFATLQVILLPAGMLAVVALLRLRKRRAVDFDDCSFLLAMIAVVVFGCLWGSVLDVTARGSALIFIGVAALGAVYFLARRPSLSSLVAAGAAAIVLRSLILPSDFLVPRDRLPKRLAQWHALADRLPDSLTFAVGDDLTKPSPLVALAWTAWRKPVYPLDLGDGRGAAALDGWLREANEKHRPTYLLVRGPGPMLTASVTREAISDGLSLWRVQPDSRLSFDPAKELATLRMWDLAPSGFFDREWSWQHKRWIRWTNGHARLRLAHPPPRISLRFATVSPRTQVTFLIDDQVVLTESYRPGIHDAEIALTASARDVVIKSDTFTPEEANDRRTLGIALLSLYN